MSFASRRSKSQSFRRKGAGSTDEAFGSQYEGASADWKIASNVRERLLGNAKGSRLHRQRKLAGNIAGDEANSEEVVAQRQSSRSEIKVHPSITSSGRMLEDGKLRSIGEISYTEEHFKDLIESQKTIPSGRIREDHTLDDDYISEIDEHMVYAARKLRESRRMNVNNETTSKELFISFSDDRAGTGGVELKRNIESRLPAEEHEEDIDDLEEYKGNRIDFAPCTLDEEKKRLRGHIQAVIDTEYPESENKAEPCIDHWEDSQIRRGIGIPQYRQSVEAEKTESESLSIPAPAPILTQEEEISELELSIEKMELSVSASERNLGMLRFDLERSKETLKVYTEELSVASKTYEFFQELNNYVMDLSEFIADKLAKVEKLDQLWTHTMEEEAAKTLKARQELMNLCRYFLTNPAPQDINNALSRLENSGDVVDSSFLEDLRNEREVLADERKLLLKDAKKEFRTSREMKKKLENWATGYPQLFSAAHGPDCVSSAYEFYVKYELIGYVYSDDLDIRSMKWYSELHGSHLNNSGSSTHTVTSSVTIQCVIPWFKTQLRLWDLYNCCQTKFLSRIFSQIVSIIPQASPEYTNLKNSVIDHIIQTVKVQVEKHCPHLESISRKVSDKNLFPFARFWFSRIENMQNNIMSWAPSIDRQVLEFIVEDQVTSKLQLVQEQSMFEC